MGSNDFSEKKTRKLDSEESRLTQLELLDELDKYCRANGLTYFLIAGTLLGAVRHKGFIPWDDDIDIAMLRRDYESFINHYKSDKYYIATSSNIKNYGLPFAKLCKAGTLVQESPVITDCNIGINIDIFPIDNVPESIVEQDELLKRNGQFKLLLCLKWNWQPYEKNFAKRCIKKILHYLMIGIPYSYLINQMNKNVSKYNKAETKLCSEIIWGCGKKEFVNRSVFRESVNLKFENKEYMAPVGWDEWLRNRYGDYMQLPPKEMQIKHHDRDDFILE